MRLENTLKQENLTVEQLLDTENIVNEIKQSQSKFIDFLKKNSHFTNQIIDYAIKMPDIEGDDEKKLYKYPFISSEILGTQIKGLEEILFDYNNEHDSQKEESEIEEDQHQDEEKSDKDKSPSKSEEEGEESAEKQADAKSSEEDTVNKEQEEEGQTTKEDSEQKNESEEQKISPKKSSKASPTKKNYSGKDLMNQLLSFINTEETLNDTSAGYFLKAINNVLTQSGQFYIFIADRPEILEQLVRHIKTKSISEIVLKLITTVGTEKETDNFSEQRKTLLTLLNKKYLEGESFERENISYIIHEIISTFIQGDNQYKTTKCFPSVQSYILEENFIETFFKVILDEHSDSSSVAYSATILSVLVTFYNSKIRQKSDRSSNNYYQSEDEEVNIGEEETKTITFPGEKLFEQYIPSLIKLIGTQPSGESHITSYGAEVVPLGIGKLKVVELISHIFKSENKSLINLLAQNGVYKILMELMITYPWNNLLHVLIEKIILESINISFNNSNEIVQNELFGTNFHLLEFIADKSEVELSRPGKLTKDIRLGYIGFLTSFARKIEAHTSSQTFSSIKEANQKWKQYIDTKYKAITGIENQNLGGDNPKNKKDDDIDDPNKFEIDIQKIYEKFNNYFRANKKDDTPAENKDEFEVNEDIGGDGFDNSDEENNNNNNHNGDNYYGEVVNSDGSEPDEHVPKSPEVIKKMEQEEVQSEYLAHQYWKVQNHHDIDELMEEL